MTPDPIEQLLREADSQTTKAVVTGNAHQLADRVIQASRRRRRVSRVTTSAAALVLVVTCAGLIWWQIDSMDVRQVARQVPPQPPNATDSAHELETIRSEIAMREAIVVRLLASERRAAGAQRLASIALTPDADQITEEAAAAVVFQAERGWRATGQADSAIQTWQRVIEQFPRTASAQTARRLITNTERERKG
jgi:hypothetical protein